MTTFAAHKNSLAENINRCLENTGLGLEPEHIKLTYVVEERLIFGDCTLGGLELCFFADLDTDPEEQEWKIGGDHEGLHLASQLPLMLLKKYHSAHNEQHIEMRHLDDQLERCADILDQVATALLGPPKDKTLHDWSQLPKLITTAKNLLPT